jgi:hypothetical protein
MAACRFEVHHRIPRYLLGFFDWFAMADLDGEGLQAWFEWEGEAFRYGVDSNVSREELELVIEVSASPVPAAAHRSGHSRSGDFVRWGRRGGLRTLALYGRGWFVLLVGGRWEKITLLSAWKRSGLRNVSFWNFVIREVDSDSGRPERMTERVEAAFDEAVARLRGQEPSA